MRIIILLPLLLICLIAKMFPQEAYHFNPFIPPVSFKDSSKRVDTILVKLSTDKKIHLVGGYNMFFIKGYPKYGMPGKTVTLLLRKYYPERPIHPQTAYNYREKI